MATSGSLKERPIRRLREPMVFFRLEISPPLAASPMCLLRAVKATRELE
jgi:hypothetical protein